MVSNLGRLVDKIFYMVPVRYLSAASAGVVGLLLLGIANTVLNPSASDVALETTGITKPAVPLLVEKGKVTVPDTINKGNIFRKQRENFIVPPPPAPQPAPVVIKEVTPVEFKLLGTIVTDFRRIAILNADQKAASSGTPNLAHLSGARLELAKKRLAAQKAQQKKGEPQSFSEGANVFDYVLERVYQDRIEVVNLINGVRSVVYIEEDAGDRSAPPSRLEEEALKKEAAKPIKVSGATTKAADPSRSSAMGAQAEKK